MKAYHYYNIMNKIYVILFLHSTKLKVKIAKNKMAPPFKQTEFDIMFGSGICHEAELIDLGVRCGLIEKGGSWFKIDGQVVAQVLHIY